MRILVVLLAVLALPAGAGAATVEMRVTSAYGGDKYNHPAADVELLVVDAAGRRNDLTIGVDGRRVTVTDASAPLEPGAGCSRVADRAVACEAPYPPFLSGELRLGGGDDVVRSGAGSMSVDGGPGDDELHGGFLRGGPGADLLDGISVSYTERTAGVRVTVDGRADDGEPGEGDDVRAAEALIGGAGDDELAGWRGAHGRFALAGGPGDDVLRGAEGVDAFDGGPGADRMLGGGGRDSATYAGRERPVRVTLAGGADDGVAGEHDDLREVEGVTGGDAGDVIVGSARGDDLSGGRGRDVLRGAAGDDLLVGDDSRSRFDVDRLVGGGGRDRVEAGRSDRVDLRDGRGGDRVDCFTQDGFVGTLRADARDRANACAPNVVVAGGLERPVRARGGRARFSVRCPAESPRACVGLLGLSFDRTLGMAAFRIPPGGRRVVAVRLNRRARTLLRRRPRGVLVHVSVSTRRSRPRSRWTGYAPNARLLPPRRPAARPRGSSASRTTAKPRAR